MRNRKDILHDLMLFNRDLKKLKDELSKYSWDLNEPILIINKVDFSNILKRCIEKEITFSDLEYWANIIECRDDIDFEEDILQEMIFELANTEINEEISIEKLKNYLKIIQVN